MVGEFVRSKAGHDKDKLYIVIREEGDFFYLSDGVSRKLSNPKRKRKKHVQPIHRVVPEGCLTDEEISRSIRNYEKSIQVVSE